MCIVCSVSSCRDDALPMTAVVLTLVAIAAWGRHVEGTWFAAGPIFAAYWAVWLGAAAVWGTDYAIPLAGPWFIVAAAFAVAAGGYAGAFGGGGSGGRPGGVVRPRVLRGAAAAGGAAGVAAALVTLINYGFSAAGITSEQGLFAAGSQISVARYTGTQGPGLVPWMLGICYAAALAGPFLLVGRSSLRTRLLVLLPFLGVLAFGLVFTTRFPLVLTATFTALASMLALAMRSGRAPRARARHVVLALGCAVLFAALFAVISFVRVGTSESAVRPIIYNKLKVYALGEIPAFSQWLDQSELRQSVPRAPAFGQATFGAPARILGLNASLSLAYVDRRQLRSHATGESTNIFTAFRALITDFGRGGALLFLGLLGFVAARLQHRLLNGGPVLLAPVLLACYAYLLNSNSASIFTFTNVWLGLVLAVLVLWWSDRTPGRMRRPPRRG